MVFQTLWGLCSSVLVCNYARFHARVMWWLSSKFKNKYVNGIASGDDANTLSRFSEQNGDKNVRHARYARLAILRVSSLRTICSAQKFEYRVYQKDIENLGKLSDYEFVFFSPLQGSCSAPSGRLKTDLICNLVQITWAISYSQNWSLRCLLSQHL